MQRRNAGRSRFVCLLTAALLVAPEFAAGQIKPGHASQVPVMAVLSAGIDTRNARVGDRFRATSKLAWQGPNCVLRQGAPLSGRVVEVASHSKTKPGARLALVIDHADCEGHPETGVSFQILAVIDLSSEMGPQQLAQEDARSTNLYGPDLATTGAAASMGYGSVTGAFRALEAGSNAADSANAAEGREAPKTVSNGQIVGMGGGVTMGVGTGPEASSVLQSTNHNFRLGKTATLVLTLPAPKAAMMTTSASRLDNAPNAPARTALPAKPPPTLEADKTEVCADGCTEEGPLAAGALQAERGGDELALKTLGYRPKHRSFFKSFDENSTITYLGPDHVLVTFDTNRLRKRSADSWHAGNRREVRAVVIDTRTSKVLRTAVWLVDGEGQYLWKSGPNRVLVSMGGSLHIFDGDLKAQNIISLGGDLLWVATSPQGARTAFGVLQEQHTREVHEALEGLSRVPPEEAVRISLVDGSGNLLLSRSGGTKDRPPVLTDGGEILVRALAWPRWEIDAETPAGVDNTLATIQSNCAPSASASSDDAVFVTGCSGSGRWYRLLGKDGRTIVKGSPSMRLVEPAAVGDGDVYALRVVQVSQPKVAGEMVATGEVQKEQISVHRGRDGRRLLLAEPHSFPQSIHNFALSGDGRQVAALTATGVAFFRVADAR